MKKKKLIIGFLALVAIFSLNFNHAFNNYGILNIKAQGLFMGSNPAYTFYTNTSYNNQSNDTPNEEAVQKKYYYIIQVAGKQVKKIVVTVRKGGAGGTFQTLIYWNRIDGNINGEYTTATSYVTKDHSKKICKRDDNKGQLDHCDGYDWQMCPSSGCPKAGEYGRGK